MVWARRRAAIWVVLPALWGCGAAVVQPRPTAPTELGIVHRSDGPGPDLAVVARASGDLVQLALWVDAGALDAQPPQLATLGAWLAAEAAGGGVVGRAWPDGLELSLPCRQRELPTCLGRLARALGLRTPEPARIEAARQRLAEARRQAAANDPRRGADELAFRALYGEHATSLQPLGVAAGDARADAEAVRAFLAAHFGAGHALLVAAGELSADELATAAKTAFARTPRALQEPAKRHAAPEPSDAGRAQVAVAVDRVPALSLALAAPDLAAAQGAATALRERLQTEALGTAIRGNVFAVRGAALALLRVRTSDPEAVVRAAAHELERLRREGVPTAPLQAPGDDLAALAHRVGARWSGGEQARAVELSLGVGVLVPGGRADRVKLDDPDAPLRQTWQARLEAAALAGRALAEPRLEGSHDERAASVVLDNGARVELRQRAGEQFAVAVRFGCGAASDPPLLHGRAALLATLGATACAGLDPADLAARVQALGAELAPRVDADSLGLLLTAPAAHWQEALELSLACALHPSLERKTLAAARLRLRERQGPVSGAGELRAATAELLAPNAPGTLEPWGSPVRQTGIGIEALRELWAGCRRGPGLVVSAVGPAPADLGAERVARRLSLLPAGKAEAPSPKPVPASAAPDQTKLAVEQPTLGLAVWRTPMPNADAAGARAFAALMRASLGNSPGVSAIWHDGGLTADGAWAAVGLSGPPAQLAAVAARLADSARSLPAASLERAADQAFELAEGARTATSGSPSAEAEALARAAYRPPPPVPNREATHALAARLAKSDPLWLPLK
jgi:predicted Zn-dependent peptidase